jgi:hypothetical protein
MAEDLGNININILGGEGGGGGGGIGGIGGGPAQAITGRLFGPQTQADFFGTAAMKSLRERVASGKDFGLAAESFKRQLLRGGEGQRLAVASASTLRDELMGFIRRPSGGAAASLLQEGTKTSALFKTMGTAGKIAGTALLGVGIAFSAAAAGIAILESSLDQVLRRIEEIYRFDPILANAKVNESIQKMSDAFAEASSNGRAYAKVLDANTQAESMKTWMSSQFNTSMTGMLLLWSKLKTATFALVGSVFYASAQLVRYGEMLMSKIRASSAQIEFFIGLGGSLTSWLIPILKYLGIIADNTKPKTDANQFNSWIKADIQAMTGVAYNSGKTYGIGTP